MSCIEAPPLVPIIKSSGRRAKTISHHVSIVKPNGDGHTASHLGHGRHSLSDFHKTQSHDSKSGIVVTVKRCKSVSWTEPPPKTTRPPPRTIPRCFRSIVDPLLQNLFDRPDATISRSRHLRTRTGETLSCQVLRVSSYSKITEHMNSRTIMYVLQGSVQIPQRAIRLEPGQSIRLAAMERTTVRNVGEDEVLVLILAEALNSYNIVG